MVTEEQKGYYVGIDLGGTNIAAGGTDGDHKILFEHSGAIRCCLSIVFPQICQDLPMSWLRQFMTW